MGKKDGKRNAAAQLEQGPIRHGSLHPELIARIGSIARAFEEVNGQPTAEWVQDFQRDHIPEQEVAIWEELAAAFTVFIKDRSLTIEAKKEAFHLLLMRSMNDEQTVLNKAPLKHLGPADAVALLTAFDSVGRPEEWGFRSEK